MGRLQGRLNQGTAWLDVFFPAPPSSLKSLVQQDSAPPPPQLCSHQCPMGIALPFILVTMLPIGPGPSDLFQKAFFRCWRFTESSFVLVLGQDEFSRPFC